MKFKLTYKYIQTEIPNKCTNCKCNIFLRDGEDSYSLNGKHICRSCLKDFSNKLGISMSELINR